MAGAAISSITTVETAAIVRGRRSTNMLQRSQAPPPRGARGRRRRAAGASARRRSAALGALRAPPRAAARPGQARSPAIVSSAGSSVSEASITSSTPIDAEIATP